MSGSGDEAEDGSAERPMEIGDSASDTSSSSGSDVEEASPPGSPRGRPQQGSNINNCVEAWGEVEDIPAVHDEKAALLEEFARKRRARQLHVPTDDKEVGALLRSHEQPYCLFGEGPAERRDRLKELLSRLDPDALPVLSGQQPVRDRQPAAEQTWYHPGPPALKECREYLVQYSIPRARDRLERERESKGGIAEPSPALRKMTMIASQTADSRPISSVRFSPDGASVATGSWSSMVQVWPVAGGTAATLRGHTAQVDAVAWHPSATLKEQTLQLASCGRDGKVILWDGAKSVGELPNAGGRVADLAFHPCGKLLALAVEDHSWRLWDVERGEELLFQEGHSGAVSCVGMQCDGALCVTGSRDATGRVWDLRTGRCVMLLAGHQGPLLAADWSPVGYLIATGGQDHSCRVWDVRQRATLHTLPAHTALVTGVRWQPGSGRFLATCSYDGAVKLWPANRCQMIRCLEGHGTKVMTVDVAPGGETLVSGAFDKTYKVWGQD